MVAVVNLGQISKRFMDREIFEHSFRIECRTRVTAADIFASLKEILHENDIIEIGRTDSLMWNIVVGSKTAAEILRDCGNITIKGRETRVVSVSYQLVEVRCHWLPSYIKDEFLKYIFSDYGRVKEVKRDNTVIGANIQRQNGIRLVILETDDLMKGGIPHLMKFEGGISMLITMPGRPPLCLRCQNIGHLRRDCNIIYRQQEPQRKTYASAAASGTPVVEEARQESQEEETRKDQEMASEASMEEVVEPEVRKEEDRVEKQGEWQTVKVSKKKGKEQETHGTRRSWMDAEGFDLEAASQGHLCLDEREEDAVTIKRSKMDDENVFSILGGGEDVD